MRAAEPSLLRRTVAAFVVSSLLLVALGSAATWLTVRHALGEQAQERLRDAAAQAGAGPARIEDIDAGVLGGGSGGAGAAGELADPSVPCSRLDDLPGDVAARVIDPGGIECDRGGEPAREAAHALDVPLRDGATLQLRTSAADDRRTLRQLALALLGTTIMSAIVAMGAGVLVARVSLARLHATLDDMRRATAGSGRAGAGEGAGDGAGVGEGAGEQRASTQVPVELAGLVASHNALLGRVADLGEAQRRIVVDVAHELRTPVTSALANMEVLARTGADAPDAEEIVGDVRDQLRELGRMVDDAVDIARLRTSTAPQWTRVDLGELARGAVERARVLHPGVTFVVEGAGEVVAGGGEGPATVVGDAYLLGRAVANLLDNAAKLSPEGGAVRIEVRGGDGAGEVHELRVRDAGPGIAEDVRATLFAPFVRADRDRSLPGSGLGLSLVAGTAQVHGGTIEARNVEPTGAEFVLRLPTAAGASTDSQEAPRLDQAASKQPSARWGSPTPRSEETTAMNAQPQPSEFDPEFAPHHSLVAVPDAAEAQGEETPAGDSASTAPRRSVAGHLARLSSVPMLVTLLVGTAASVVYWVRCGLGHTESLFGGWHAMEYVCFAAGGTAAAVLVSSIVATVSISRRRAGSTATWWLNGTLLAVAFAGASLLLMLRRGVGGEEIGASPMLDALPGQSAFAVATVVATFAAIVLGRATVGAIRGRRSAGLLARATAFGLLGTCATWTVHTIVTGTPIGASSLAWTLEPAYALAAMLLTGVASAAALAISGAERGTIGSGGSAIASRLVVSTFAASVVASTAIVLLLAQIA